MDDWLAVDHKFVGFARTRGKHYALCSCGYETKMGSPEAAYFRLLKHHIAFVGRVKARADAQS